MRDPLELWLPLDAGPPFPCPYLAGRLARFELGTTLPTAEDLDRLLALGYRRSGRVFYAPACPSGCVACTPIRIPTSGFRPTRSQRRLWARRHAEFTVEARGAHFDDETYGVFRRHHARVSPDDEPATEDGYRWSFVETCVDTRFVEFRVGGRLAAVSVLDVGERAASSVYCSWDPDFAALGPGTFSVLWEIDWCRRQGLESYYLGYWVQGCPKLEYKDRFGPFETFDWAGGVWRPSARASAPDPGGPADPSPG